MSRLRLFLAWLVLATMPLQAIAGASLLLCGASTGTGMHAAAAQPHPASGASGAPASHHHTSAAVDTDGHRLAVGGGLDGSAHAMAGGLHGGSPHGAAQPFDMQHACSVCASCCHGTALAEFAHWPALTPMPQAPWAMESVPVDARPLPLPDKPPRA